MGHASAAVEIYAVTQGSVQTITLKPITVYPPEKTPRPDAHVFGGDYHPPQTLKPLTHLDKPPRPDAGILGGDILVLLRM